MLKFKHSQNHQRHQFLLTFFTDNRDVIEVNGFILKKYFNEMIHEHQVAIYTKESFSRAADFQQTQSHMQSIKQQSLMDGD